MELEEEADLVQIPVSKICEGAFCHVMDFFQYTIQQGVEVASLFLNINWLSVRREQFSEHLWSVIE